MLTLAPLLAFLVLLLPAEASSGDAPVELAMDWQDGYPLMLSISDHEFVTARCVDKRPSSCTIDRITTDLQVRWSSTIEVQAQKHKTSARFGAGEADMRAYGMGWLSEATRRLVRTPSGVTLWLWGGAQFVAIDVDLETGELAARTFPLSNTNTKFGPLCALTSRSGAWSALVYGQRDSHSTTSWTGNLSWVEDYIPRHIDVYDPSGVAAGSSVYSWSSDGRYDQALALDNDGRLYTLGEDRGGTFVSMLGPLSGPEPRAQKEVYLQGVTRLQGGAVMISATGTVWVLLKSKILRTGFDKRIWQIATAPADLGTPPVPTQLDLPEFPKASGFYGPGFLPDGSLPVTFTEFDTGGDNARGQLTVLFGPDGAKRWTHYFGGEIAPPSGLWASGAGEVAVLRVDGELNQLEVTRLSAETGNTLSQKLILDAAHLDGLGDARVVMGDGAVVVAVKPHSRRAGARTKKGSLRVLWAPR